MNEKPSPTFLERLTLIYPGQFEIERKKGIPPHDQVTFSAKNEKFGDINIHGDLDEWRDEEDYFIEDENGVYDDKETCGFWFRVGGHPGIFIMSPTEIFDYLEKIFSDQIVVYSSLFAKKRGLYELKNLKKLLKEGKISKRKTYHFWSGDYSVSIEDDI